MVLDDVGLLVAFRVRLFFGCLAFMCPLVLVVGTRTTPCRHFCKHYFSVRQFPESKAGGWNDGGYVLLINSAKSRAIDIVPAFVPAN